MTNQFLESLAKAAGQSLSDYTRVTLGIFEPKGTRGNRADTAARVAIWAEAIKLGIKGKEKLGADQWEDFLKQCINTHALRAVAPRINAYFKLSTDARLRSKDHNCYLALEEFTQEALRRRRSSRGDNNDQSEQEVHGKRLSDVVLSSLNDDC
jgi:hypothetical protein